jgi:FdhD protein
MRNKPNVTSTLVSEWSDGTVRDVDDFLATEEPLDIRIGETQLGISLRTPGNDRELVTGLLFTEGLIDDVTQLSTIEVADCAGSEEINGQPTQRNFVRVTLRAGSKLPGTTTNRGFSAGSACGACGKATIDDLRLRGARWPNESVRSNAEVLCRLPEKLRESQAAFGRTGGLHAAALFDPQGKLIVAREDIGRHNAVDKVIGWSLLENKAALSECVMLVSGRGGFEIVTKAIIAGIPILASISAPSSLAVQTARELGLTLIGFLRGRRFIIYAHGQRLVTGSD